VTWYASDEKMGGGFLNKNYVRKSFLCFKDGVSEYFIFPDILRENDEVVLIHSLCLLTAEQVELAWISLSSWAFFVCCSLLKRCFQNGHLGLSAR